MYQYSLVFLSILLISACGGGSSSSSSTQPIDQPQASSCTSDCGENPENNTTESQNEHHPDVSGCGISGSRLLSNSLKPLNYFSGSYYSRKTWNEGAFEWYPLELSVSESDTNHNSTISGEAEPDCREVASFLLQHGYYNYGLTFKSEMEINFRFNDFDYDQKTFARDIKAEKVSEETPVAEITISKTQFDKEKKTTITISEVRFSAKDFTCSTPFNITTYWKKNAFDADIDKSTEIRDPNSGDNYALTHEVKHTWNDCTFSFGGTLELDSIGSVNFNASASLIHSAASSENTLKLLSLSVKKITP